MFILLSVNSWLTRTSRLKHNPASICFGQCVLKDITTIYIRIYMDANKKPRKIKIPITSLVAIAFTYGCSCTSK